MSRPAAHHSRQRRGKRDERHQRRRGQQRLALRFEWKFKWRGRSRAPEGSGTLFWGYDAHADGPCGLTVGLANGIGKSNGPCSGSAYASAIPVATFAESGSQFAAMAISPVYGHLFGSGATFSYESSLARNSADTLDIELSSALAPAGLAATPTTGGTLAAGTYYYSIQSYPSGSSSTPSAGSTEITATLSGSSNAVALSWTAPAGTNPGGCYIYRSTSAMGTFYGSSQRLTTISNCTSTTSYTDTGATLSSGVNALTTSTLGAYYHFAPLASNTSGGTVPVFTGSPSGCATWSSAGTLTGTSGSCGGSGGSTQTAFVPSPNNAGNQAAPSSANAVNVVAFWIPFAVSISHLTVDIGTADTTSGSLCGSFADCYDVGIYNLSGAVQCSWGATPFSVTGMTDNACKQGSVTLNPGYYVFAFTGNATTAKIYFGSGAGMQLLAGATSSTSSSGGALPNSISVPTFAGGAPNLDSTYSNVYLALTQN